MTDTPHAHKRDRQPDETWELHPTPPDRAPAEPSASATEDFLQTISYDPDGTDSAADLAGARRADPAPPVHLPAAPRAVTGYTLLGELGRGGMGVVYKAWQHSLKRLVALKMVLAGGHARPEQVARFRAEAEAVAQLQHPNIVQVYEIGEHDGLPFFCMELVDGGNLAQKVSGGPLPPRQAARLTEAVARGAHAAHQHGLVHRDLKPQNIMLTRDGTPKVTDFGLAKNLFEQSASTDSSAIVGTPSYMAPEQSRRDSDVGVPADVYALGAILYELLTGRPPFQGDSSVDILLQVRSQEPEPPSRHQPGLPRDLETICLACLAKEPGRRYASAEALAEDLRAFLEGRPVAARPLGVFRRVRDWADRWPVLTAGAGAVLGLGAAVAWLNPRAGGAAAVLAVLLVGAWLAARLRASLGEGHDRRLAAERNVERVRSALEMTCGLLAARDLDGQLRLLCETATRLANAQFATIYLLDRQSGELRSRVLLDERVREICLPLGVGVAGNVAVTGETVNLPDAYTDQRFYRAIDQQSGRRTRSLLTFPMAGRDRRVLGVFQVMNKRSGPFTREDMEMLSFLNRAAGAAIERAEGGTGTAP
jgi:serine/threonine-protein kinase